MGHLILKGQNITWQGFSLLGESSLAITLDDTGAFQQLDFLVLSGTTSVSIASIGLPLGENLFPQLAETTNDLTTVTISGWVLFELGSQTGHSNSGDGVVTDIAATAASPTTIHSSLALIDASATTGGLQIYAGATNSSTTGSFDNGGNLSGNVTITYTGLTIKGGSGDAQIENDAKNGIVTVGNGIDTVILGGADATAKLGTGAGDHADVGFSDLGTIETPGSALGDSVKFGAAATAHLVVGMGAEVGSTVGLTKVLNAAAGMKIDFSTITGSNNVVATPAQATLATTENEVCGWRAALSAMAR